MNVHPALVMKFKGSKVNKELWPKVLKFSGTKELLYVLHLFSWKEETTSKCQKKEERLEDIIYE